MTNKIATYYIGDSISTRFRANIEFSFPILWRVLPKETRQQIGKRFDKTYLEGDAETNKKAIELLILVDGLRYLSTTTRRLIYEPKIKFLEEHLDDWAEEARAVKNLEAYGSVVPDELIGRLVSALTLTFVGYRGSSYSYSRTTFYSNAAAPTISKMFEKFDNKSAEEFVNTIQTNQILKARIRGAAQLNRLRALGDIILNKPEIKDNKKSFLEILVDEKQTKEFYHRIAD